MNRWNSLEKMARQVLSTFVIILSNKMARPRLAKPIEMARVSLQTEPTKLFIFYTYLIKNGNLEFSKLDM